MDLLDIVNILLALLGFLLRPGVLNTERFLQHQQHLVRIFNLPTMTSSSEQHCFYLYDSNNNNNVKTGYLLVVHMYTGISGFNLDKNIFTITSKHLTLLRIYQDNHKLLLKKNKVLLKCIFFHMWIKKSIWKVVTS